MPLSGRDANGILRGCVEVRLRHYVDAQRYFDLACAMDPYNIEYETPAIGCASRPTATGRLYDYNGARLLGLRGLHRPYVLRLLLRSAWAATLIRLLRRGSRRELAGKGSRITIPRGV